MNRDIKDRWIAALQSGEYTQIKNWLHTDCGFCALGVLADLYQQEHTETCKWQLASDGNRFILSELEYTGLTLTEDTDLLYTTMAWADIKDSEITEDIVRMNDDGRTFYEIAKFIDKNL